MFRGIRSFLRRLFRASPGQVSDVALTWAAEREALPSALGSREQREVFDRETRSRAVFSARTANAEYLQGLRDAVDRVLIGGRDNDLPQLRLELKQLLTRLEYTPETGFPGDAELGIEPAEPGSLRDLSSDARINLILETQIRLARGASQKLRGMEPDRLRAWPAWELVRVLTRRVPRGSAESGSEGWAGRWLRAGGPVLASGKLMALKSDPVWANLGDGDLFDDGLDTDHPPFAFNSGMGWREVPRDEAVAAGLLTMEEGLIGEATLSDRRLNAEATARAAGLEAIPKPVANVRGLDPDLRAELVRQVKARRDAKPDYVRYGELLASEVGAAQAAYLKRNPDLVAQVR